MELVIFSLKFTFFLLFSLKLSTLLFFLPLTLYSLFYHLGFKGKYRFALSIGLSPALLSWFYMLQLRFMSGHSSTFYLLLTTTPFIFSIFQPTVLRYFLKEFLVFKPIFEEKLNLTLTSVLLLFIFLWFLNMPLLGNDSLEYFYISHLIDTKKDIGFYPSLSGIEPRGMVLPFTHPIGYPTLLAWGQLSLGEGYGLFTGKVLSFMCVFLTVLTATLVQIQEKIKPYLLFSLVFLTVPIVFSNVLEAHVDSARMLLFFLSMLALYDHFKNQGSLILVGVSCGLSWFFHSSGVLTLVMVLGTYGFFSLLQERRLSMKMIKNVFLGSIIITFSALPFLALDFIKIYSVHGKLIGDLQNIKIINLLSDEYEHFLAVSRDIESIDKKFLKLISQLFLSPFLFGFAYWLAFIGMCISLKYTLKNLKYNQWNYIDYSFVVVIFFYALIILATFTGVSTFVFNPRYLLQILPLISFLGIFALRRWV